MKTSILLLKKMIQLLRNMIYIGRSQTSFGLMVSSIIVGYLSNIRIGPQLVFLTVMFAPKGENIWGWARVEDLERECEKKEAEFKKRRTG